jgi:hypothetical protein
MRTSMRTASVMLLSTGALALGDGAAVAAEPGAGAAGRTSAGQGFAPGPDYTDFEPGPDYENFEPGAAPGTADLVDDNAARLLGPVVRGLFG